MPQGLLQERRAPYNVAMPKKAAEAAPKSEAIHIRMNQDTKDATAVFANARFGGNMSAAVNYMATDYLIRHGYLPDPTDKPPTRSSSDGE